jgi:hypothetical protein
MSQNILSCSLTIVIPYLISLHTYTCVSLCVRSLKGQACKRVLLSLIVLATYPHTGYSRYPTMRSYHSCTPHVSIQCKRWFATVTSLRLSMSSSREPYPFDSLLHSNSYTIAIEDSLPWSQLSALVSQCIRPLHLYLYEIHFATILTTRPTNTCANRAETITKQHRYTYHFRFSRLRSNGLRAYRMQEAATSLAYG